MYDNSNMMFFSTRCIWLDFDISQNKRKKRIEALYGKKRVIDDVDEAITCLSRAIDSLNQELLDQISNNNTYVFLLDVFCILNLIISYYEQEKKDRIKMMEVGFREKKFIDSITANRNIEKNIIDACNIWIENGVLHQSKLELIEEKTCTLNKELLLDLYLYGFSSQALSLLRLSKNLRENPFMGLIIDPRNDMPLNILKDHPIIYHNPAVGGNQSALYDKYEMQNIENMEVAKGFVKEYGISFSSYLGRIAYFKDTLLKGNVNAQLVMGKTEFINMVNSLEPSINGQTFFECVAINQEKVKSQLAAGEKTIWRMGVNQYRLELRPIVELTDGNVIVNYAACFQALNIWFSLCVNGGSCYRQTRKKDCLLKGMELRNKQLADRLLIKIQGILRNNYRATVDYLNVNYKRIFGIQEVDYGDYDIVFYSAERKELFLIESKYLSDSLNASGSINDYSKMFSPGGYYDHCRARCDLVRNNPEKMKSFINVSSNDSITVFFLFVSSKPLEIDLQDKDGIVTFLSLNTLDGFIKGKFSRKEDNEIVRPGIII